MMDPTVKIGPAADFGKDQANHGSSEESDDVPKV